MRTRHNISDLSVVVLNANLRPQWTCLPRVSRGNRIPSRHPRQASRSSARKSTVDTMGETAISSLRAASYMKTSLRRANKLSLKPSSEPKGTTQIGHSRKPLQMKWVHPLRLPVLTGITFRSLYAEDKYGRVIKSFHSGCPVDHCFRQYVADRFCSPSR